MQLRVICASVLIASLMTIHAHSSFGQDLYSDDEVNCIAAAIYQSECGGKEQALVSWNINESFPSLGIGHFIWTEKNHQKKFWSSFPSLIEFMVQQGAIIPEPLKFIQEDSPPWKNRNVFEAQKNSKVIEQIQQFLVQTKDLQAQFILRRASDFVDQIRKNPDYFHASQRLQLEDLLLSERGRYALMDYINFKGEGFLESESYLGKGWGAIQVLSRMTLIDHPDAVERFAQSAEAVLKQRVQNSGRVHIESKWLPGWMNRIDHYRRFECAATRISSNELNL